MINILCGLGLKIQMHSKKVAQVPLFGMLPSEEVPNEVACRLVVM